MEQIARKPGLTAVFSMLLFINLSAGSFTFSTDTVKNLVSLNPPTNLYVDPLTLSVIWNRPLINEPDTNYIDFWVYLDEDFLGVTEDTTWDLAPLIYGQVYTASVGARYASGMSAMDTCMFTCVFLFPPDSLEGDAPDNAAILSWDPPMEFWPMNNASSRDVGEVIFNWTAPSPISGCWGICDDGQDLWITDPTVSGSNIFQVTYDGSYTGFMITVNQGQGWIADMVSDGEYLYCCLVGGPNTIAKIDLATGATVSTISGDWAGVPQQGLTADFINEEFYIGGWTSDRIWRTTFSGVTISYFEFDDASGLAWHPMGGPDMEGSLWVVKYSADDYVYELDPNNEWVNLQFFSFPNGQQYSGAGAEVCRSGNYAGALWLPNQSDNNIYLINVDEYPSCCPPGILPENLLGYNIYRDSIFVAYTAHWPEGEWLPQNFIDLNLDPGIYEYAVSAVYDLEIYGYPDETDESFLEGPAEVEVNYCFDLEFNETWQVGNFNANSWNVGGDNWTISGNQGNPPGCVGFSGVPVQFDYEIALESYPLCADEMTEGHIWLDFDLKLDVVHLTGEERLEIQAWGWESQQWDSVAGYNNGNGSFDWINEHLDIREHAMNQVFKVRFIAKGTNSSDISGWYIDNIHIYRTCDGVTGLEAIAEAGSQQGILLNWYGPDYNLVDEWIHWDDGQNYGNSIGTNCATDIDVAQRWDAGQLEVYDGASITQVSFFPAEEEAEYIVRVWKGANAENMLVNQPVPDPVIGQWNNVTLITPVLLDITKDLWVGYNVFTNTGYPFGVDNGPAVDGYGNMMNCGGWQTLLNINPELDYNWNINTHVQTLAGLTMTMEKSVEPVTNKSKTYETNPNISGIQQVLNPGNTSRDLIGYNIYRSIDGSEYEMIDYTTESTYLDIEGYPVIGSLYCYIVTAVWESETDQCESAFSEESCEVWTGIGDSSIIDASGFSLYPNPADDHVLITSPGELKRVTVYNTLGQLVADEITTDKQYELETDSYTVGVYMVRIETGAGVTTRPLTIQR